MRPLKKLDTLYVMRAPIGNLFGGKLLTSYIGVNGQEAILDGMDIHIDLSEHPEIGIDKLLLVKNIKAGKVVYFGELESDPKHVSQLVMTKPVFTKVFK